MYSREQSERNVMRIDEDDESKDEDEMENDIGRSRTESLSINGQFLDEAVDKGNYGHVSYPLCLNVFISATTITYYRSSLAMH
jgi:hypothetical protein